MTNKTYNLQIGDLLKTAWTKIYGYKRTFFPAFVIIGVLQTAVDTLRSSPDRLPLSIQLLSIIVFGFVILVSYGVAYLGIKRADDQPIKFQMIGYVFNAEMFLKLVGNFLLKALLYGILVLILIFCSYLADLRNLFAAYVAIVLQPIGIVLYIYMVCRLYLSAGFILEKRLDPLQAIYKSFHHTKDNAAKIFGLILLVMIIIILSAIPLAIGLIWTLPLGAVAYGELYKRLSTLNDSQSM